MKKWVIGLLLAYFAVMLLVPGYTIFRHYQTLTLGEPFYFSVASYDPYDPFRGRYVRLQTVERVSYYDNQYVILGRNEERYAVIQDVQDKKPRSGAYVRNMDISRYYMNERQAPQAERVTRTLSEEDSMYLKVMVKNGHYVIEGLYMNGVRIEDWVTG